MKYDIALGYNSKLDRKSTFKNVNYIANYLLRRLNKIFPKIDYIQLPVVTSQENWLNDDNKGTTRTIDFDFNDGTNIGEILTSPTKYLRWFLYVNNINTADEGIYTNGFIFDRDVTIKSTQAILEHTINFEVVQTEINEKSLREKFQDFFKQFIELDEIISIKESNLYKSHIEKTLIFISYKKLKNMYPMMSFEECVNHFARENGPFVLENFIEKAFLQKEENKFSQDIVDFSTYSRLYVINNATNIAIEILNMGYSVDENRIKIQIDSLKENKKTISNYDASIANNLLPLTITGSISVPRLAMVLLEKQHIAEVQHSVWPDELIEFFNKNEIEIF